MRIVVQRTGPAHVMVNEQMVGHIDHGLVLLVGVGDEDSEADAQYLADKVVHLRVFEDEDGKMNRDLRDTGGSVLSVSQFTLYGDVRKGRRPSYAHAALPDRAEQLYQCFNECVKTAGIPLETGQFGAMMDVHLVNDGPVTILLDSKKSF